MCVLDAGLSRQSHNSASSAYHFRTYSIAEHGVAVVDLDDRRLGEVFVKFFDKGIDGMAMQ
jgi:hypothetical protein